MSRVWTITIKGGLPFGMDIPGNPYQVHDGTWSVWNIYGERQLADRILEMASMGGASISITGELQTPSQAAERQALQDAQQRDAVFPSIECPECLWFDPVAEHKCGYTGWSQETVTEAFECHDKATSDLEKCPIHGQGSLPPA